VDRIKSIPQALVAVTNRIKRRPRVLAAVAIGVCLVLIVSSFVFLIGPGSSGGGSPSPAPTGSSIAALPTPATTPTPTLPALVPSITPSATPISGVAGVLYPDLTGSYADLDGVLTTPALAHRLPMAIMVDDAPAARPQAGFNGASIVYQAPADGGQTRYMLVFQEGSSADVGPVRSARPYFVRWAAEYHALLGHYGGDNQSLTQVIPGLAKSIYNMDALNGGGCPYHRISTRLMPHNAYTNTSALRACLPKKHYPTTIDPTVPLRPFTDDLPLSQRPSAATITIPYRSQVVGYTYVRSTDSYLRSVGGRPQIDQSNKTRVTARNVIVLWQTLTTYTEPGHNRPVVGQIGTGKAMVFRDGQAIPATWQKKNDTDLTRLYDASGQEIPLVRGRIFIQIVPTGTKVTHTQK
jgi:hypothetical protein